MSETILGNANRQADRLNFEIRSGVVQEVDVLNRQWIVSEEGAIYHYLHFDPDLDEFGSLSVYDLRGRPWELKSRTFATHAKFETDKGWEGHGVWVRDLASNVPQDRALVAADVQPLTFLESPDYFETDPPDAERMNVRELGTYIENLGASGFPVVKLVVALHRKMSFPFVTLILTLIAVPFGVTMGPRGALYGIGVGITLACTYWITMSIFGAIGSAGMLAPMLAAWAPNLLFGASATYLLLTVRT
jgi:lipopolysaccharide export LptBFGC system permease protein LptF